MTQPPTPDSDRRDPLGFDELLALLLAFSAVGAILWWSIGRRAETWVNQSGLLGTAQTQTAATPGLALPSPIPPSPSASPAATLPEAALPEALPEAALPAAAGVAPNAVVIAGAARVTRPAAPTLPPSGLPVAPVAPPVAPVAPPVAPVGQRPVIVIPTAVAQATPFSDVPTSYWAYPFIEALSQRGLITGVNDGTFKPDEPVNRAQYAALLSGLLRNSQQGEIPFSDVPANFWGSEAIDEAVKSEFLKGYPDQTFQPEQPISRLQVLLSLANGFALPKPADPEPALQSFANRQQIPDWAKPAVAAAAQANVVVSYPDVKQFEPNQPATRAEVAAMLYQALRTKGNLPPIQSAYILQP